MFVCNIYILQSDSNSSVAMCYSVRKYQAEKEAKNGLVRKVTDGQNETDQDTE